MHERDRLNLLSIEEAITKILEFTNGIDDVDDFYDDKKTFDATLMNFVVIGEMVAKIEDDLKKENPQIEWSKIKSFRNIVAHEYFGIDAEEVWQIIKTKLPVLKKEVYKILRS